MHGQCVKLAGCVVVSDGRNAGIPDARPGKKAAR